MTHASEAATPNPIPSDTSRIARANTPTWRLLVASALIGAVVVQLLVARIDVPFTSAEATRSAIEAIGLLRLLLPIPFMTAVLVLAMLGLNRIKAPTHAFVFAGFATIASLPFLTDLAWAMPSYDLIGTPTRLVYSAALSGILPLLAVLIVVGFAPDWWTAHPRLVKTVMVLLALLMLAPAFRAIAGVFATFAFLATRQPGTVTQFPNLVGMAIAIGPRTIVVPLLAQAVLAPALAYMLLSRSRPGPAENGVAA